MRPGSPTALLSIALALGAAACARPGVPQRLAATPEPRSTPAPVPAPTPPPSASPPAAPAKEPPPPDPGRANLDPSDDSVVAPPDPIADCEERLKAAGVQATAGSIPPRPQAGGYVCGAEQIVIYQAGPSGASWNAKPAVTCSLALGLARFETLLQEEAERTLGSRVKRIVQGGTYSCRKMARFRLVSEHSYANAIDIRGFQLEDGRYVSVKTHFGSLSAEPTRAEGRFLRDVAHRTFDEEVFSVVLTPFWDSLHADHFHLDQARYRVDGTRGRDEG